MSAVAASPSTTARTARGHLGLVVLGAVASGLVLGLLLVLAAFPGAPEHEITGAALVALGAGFAALAAASRRFTDQPQTWARVPGAAFSAVGLLLWIASPGGRALELAGWLWPALVLVLVGWSLRGAHRSLRNWSRRVVLYPSLVVLLLVAVGGAFETVVEATTTNRPLAGRTYLVNGHRLYLTCAGTGAPTVVLFNGLGERTPSWSWVQRAVSSSTRVCAYDRAGEGWSGGAAVVQDGAQLSSDLHGLLRAAHVPGPYVLAGHSVGGVYALLYAKHYADDVAGVALIDSATPHQFDLPDYPGFYEMWRRGSALMPVFARAGLVRLTAGRTAFAGLPARARKAARAFVASPREQRADRVEFLQLPHLLDEAKAVESLGGRPLRVLSATVGQQRGWSAAQARLAKLSANSGQRAVTGATHEALLEDEDFASITGSAIEEVVQSVRTR